MSEWKCIKCGYTEIYKTATDARMECTRLFNELKWYKSSRKNK